MKKFWNKNCIILISAVCGGILIVALVLCLVLGKDTSEPVLTSAPPVVTTDASATDTPDATDGTTKIPQVVTTVPEITYDLTVPTETDGTTPPASEDIQPSEMTQPQALTEPPTDLPTETTVPTNTLTMPYQIPGTTLTIRKIGSYSGIFLEDGSDKEISDVAAIVLTNNGDVGVEYVRIQMNCNGTELVFVASCLPAGGTVMVQEANTAIYQANAAYTDCTADVATLEEFEMSADKIGIVENSDGSLQLTNLTDEVIPCVRIFYKFFMGDEGVYVGGITYNSKIVDLQPGVSQSVKPSHYVSEASRVVMIRTYTTAN